MKRRKDIILDNKYNQNDIEADINKDIKIDDNFLIEDTINPELEQFIYNQLKKKLPDSDFVFKKGWRKQKNEEFVRLFYEIYKELDCRFFNEIEYFIAFCDIFKIPYQYFYQNLFPGYKIKMLDILDEKFNVMNRNKFFKIF